MYHTAIGAFPVRLQSGISCEFLRDSVVRLTGSIEPIVSDVNLSHRGYWLFQGELFFGVLFGGQLYFKTDPTTRRVGTEQSVRPCNGCPVNPKVIRFKRSSR